MELSFMLLEQIIAMIVMALMSFIVARIGILTEADSRSLSRLCIYIVAPCALLDGFQTEFDAEKLTGLGIVTGVSIVIFLMFLLVGSLLRRVSNSSVSITPGEQCSITYTNCGNLIMPLVQNTLGSGYLIYTCAFQMVQSMLMWTHGKTLMKGETSFSWKEGLLNINMCSIYLGVTLFLLRIRLPAPLGSAVHTMGSMLGPIAMIILGISLAEMDLKTALTSLRVYRVVALRLIILPLLTLLLLWPVQLLWASANGAKVLTVALLCACGPSATMTVQLAQLYDSPERQHIAFINAVSTILCAATIPLMSALFFLMQ